MISAPFAVILAAGRSQFNQRMVEARRRHAALNGEGFSEFLQSCVDPVVCAVAAFDGPRVSAVALAAYDLGLELAGLGLVGPGARSVLVPAVWRTLAPKLASLIAQQPAEVLGLLSNAALYLESIPRTRRHDWLKGMVALAARIESIPQLQASGQIIAWRSGVAHFRSGALEAADRLPEPLALAAFGADGADAWSDLRQRMVDDPWWRPGPGAGVAQHIEIGEFAGLGGEFGEPPEVHAHAGTFTVRSGAAFYLLIADVYGALLHPSDAIEHNVLDAAKGEWKLKANVLHIGQREIDLDLPADSIRVCCNGPTLAITSPYAHSIRLVSAR